MHFLGAACVLERSTTPQGRSYFIPSTSGHSKSKGTVKTRTKTRHSELSALLQTQAELSQHSVLGKKPDQGQAFPVLLRASPYCPAGVLGCKSQHIVGGKKEQQKNCQFRENLCTQSALLLTFCFLCLINLLIVSYSIFILFCVHVTVERNTGGQGVPHRNNQKGFSTGCLGGCGLREVLWTAADQTSEEPTQGCCWEP